MNRLLIISMLITSPLICSAKTITIEIPDEEIKIVENDVLDAEQWIKDAWKGKVNKCKGRLIQSEIQTSVSKGEAIPAGEAAIVDKAFKRPDYKSRKERDLEEIRSLIKK